MELETTLNKTCKYILCIRKCIHLPLNFCCFLKCSCCCCCRHGTPSIAVMYIKCKQEKQQQDAFWAVLYRWKKYVSRHFNDQPNSNKTAQIFCEFLSGKLMAAAIPADCIFF